MNICNFLSKGRDNKILLCHYRSIMLTLVDIVRTYLVQLICMLLIATFKYSPIQITHTHTHIYIYIYDLGNHHHEETFYLSFSGIFPRYMGRYRFFLGVLQPDFIQIRKDVLYLQYLSICFSSSLLYEILR
jgi:hypothetical protein